MESEDRQDSFGDYLKNVRIGRELPIETVAARTKITVNCLRAIEASAHDRLPPQAYVKSFIRAYADAVGADAEEAIRLYQADLSYLATTHRLWLKRQANLQTIRRVLLAAGVITSILLIVRYTDFFLPTNSSPNTAENEGVLMPASPALEEQTGRRFVTEQKEPVKLTLRVVATEETWLKVIVDDQNVRSYTLKPEDRLELEGTDSFNLMIGNASGLNVFLNGEPVNIYGGNGQVVNLKLP